MGCFICGTERVKFHGNSMSAQEGKQERRDYCEPCFVATFGSQPEATQLVEHARKLREKDIQSKVLRDLERLRTKFRPKLEELIAKNPRFPFEAYEFIFASLTRAVHEMEPDPQSRGRNATAAELVRACGEQARRAWGDDAKAHAQALGFRTASDIGDIVFLLIENGYMGKRDSDNRADFDGLPFFS